MQSGVLLCSRVIPMNSTPLNVAAAILHSLYLQILFLHHKLHPFISITIEMQIVSFILHTILDLTYLLLKLLAVQHRDRKSTSGLTGTVKIVQKQLNEDERLQLLNDNIMFSIMIIKRLIYYRLLLFNHQPSHYFITLPHNHYNCWTLAINFLHLYIFPVTVVISIAVYPQLLLLKSYSFAYTALEIILKRSWYSARGNLMSNQREISITAITSSWLHADNITLL